MWTVDNEKLSPTLAVTPSGAWMRGVGEGAVNNARTGEG